MFSPQNHGYASAKSGQGNDALVWELRAMPPPRFYLLWVFYHISRKKRRLTNTDGYSTIFLGSYD